MQLEVEHPETAKLPDDSPYGTDKVLMVEKGGGYRPMPIGDIKNATRVGYSIIESSLQRGSLTAIDYGNLTFPLSAIAYTEITSGRNDILMPRIQAIAFFYQALTRMIIDQVMSFGKTITIGQPGNQREYSKSDLDGDYEIKYRFFTQSKEQTIADISIARSAEGILPLGYVYRELMKVQDPDGLLAQLKAQQAENLDEVAFCFERASSLIAMAEKKPEPEKTKLYLSAYIMAERAETILKQRRALGTLSPIEGKTERKPESQGKELLPLMAEGKGGGGRGGVSEVERAIESEEVESAKV